MTLKIGKNTQKDRTALIIIVTMSATVSPVLPIPHVSINSSYTGALYHPCNAAAANVITTYATVYQNAARQMFVFDLNVTLR
ncbi:hypothetical protein OJAG_03500 [Oerskovia enterophila]|uniref:Uncharacterized protein n=1 Tax=Oerskovia enterophila TaxID=43678 RepID=A0A163SZT3_9CELL|nr:hypothetical protein OJAG_03500 [Oerskovia enterophila]